MAFTGSISTGHRWSFPAASFSEPRAALARVLVLEPELIILDEPTSMLDVISQAQIVHFLQEYQKEHETAYLFITHNKVLAKTVCDEIYEIREGICTKKEM